MHDRKAISGEPTNLRPAPPHHPPPTFLRCLIKPNFGASRTVGKSVQKVRYCFQNNALSAWARNDTVDWLELQFPISKFCVWISILNLNIVTAVESNRATRGIIGHNAAGSWINWQSFGLVKLLPIFYGTRRYVAIYMKDVCWIVSWCRWVWLVTHHSLTSWFNFNITKF
jgi:hypothetical protein